MEKTPGSQCFTWVALGFGHWHYVLSPLSEEGQTVDFFWVAKFVGGALLFLLFHQVVTLLVYFSSKY